MKALLALTVVGGSVAHATLTPMISVAGVTPDLPLIMVILLALRRGPEFGCVAGFVTGLLQDATGGGLIGVQALTKGLIGFGIGVAGGRLPSKWSRMVWVQVNARTKAAPTNPLHSACGSTTYVISSPNGAGKRNTCKSAKRASPSAIVSTTSPGTWTSG